ncbi:hypothetical protein SAMN05216359_101311 [Roseateles sp. YR242]|uniref:hypothetical protein n=1 Tax=Roseateles sp. YR242 TaxID=1855305 RepID=UPI0008D483BF|nr:hypothetical protein [Roseateles sp. YR242]SEK29064.1 hypothetical protein SAMN05216359_101311 [Roseateles sp. YR242]
MSNTATSFADASMQAPTGPWWRHPMMWLVVGGPSVVVVASVVTLVLAMHHADPVVRHGVQTNATQASAEDPAPHGQAQAQAPSQLQPAMKARNHAATGGQEN